MCLLLWLTYLAACWGTADAFVKQAKFNMLQWQTKKMTLADWQSTTRLLRIALDLAPQHPEYLELMGEVHYLHKYITISTAKRNSAYQNALIYFSKALTQRPVSAYTWTNIALIKHQLGRYDLQFFQAINAATRLGPWEPQVQLNIVDVGLANWQKLPKRHQQAVLTMLEQGMLHQAKWVTRFIEKYQFQDELCEYGRSRQKPTFANFCLNRQSIHNVAR